MKARVIFAAIILALLVQGAMVGAVYAGHETRFKGDTALGTGAIMLTVVVAILVLGALGAVGLWLAKRDREEDRRARDGALAETRVQHKELP